MKFFFDNNISENPAQGMKAFGEQVFHLREKFPPDASDEEWLKYIGENGIVLLTRDKNIRYNPAEVGTLRRYKIKAFFLRGKNLNRCSMIQQIVRNWPKIKQLPGNCSAPFAFGIPPNGTKFTQIF
jgi:predicted nuclease of predicted toxin-antitoxin system